MTPATSESVWCEQVDTSWVEHIQSIVKFPHGNSLFSVPVDILKPDADFKEESYPRITVYHLYSERDNIRYYPDSVVVERDFDNNSLTLEKGAVPFSLFYQIDFWSRTQSDMNDMLRIWLGHHPDRDFVLPVLDLSENLRDVSVLQIGNIAKIDQVEGNQRTFHSAVTYRVWVELDERIRSEVEMITQVPYPNTVKTGG